MNGVVAAKLEGLGVLAGLADKGVVHSYRDQLFAEALELGRRLGMSRFCQAAAAPRGSQGRASLRIGQDARCRGMAAVPELACEI